MHLLLLGKFILLINWSDQFLFHFLRLLFFLLLFNFEKSIDETDCRCLTNRERFPLFYQKEKEKQSDDGFEFIFSRFTNLGFIGRYAMVNIQWSYWIGFLTKTFRRSTIESLTRGNHIELIRRIIIILIVFDRFSALRSNQFGRYTSLSAAKFRCNADGCRNYQRNRPKITSNSFTRF